jgi:hypothetical protein
VVLAFDAVARSLERRPRFGEVGHDCRYGCERKGSAGTERPRRRNGVTRTPTA